MSLAHNPHVCTDGLVGYWDAANAKSYRETDGTNLVTNGTFDTDSGWTLNSATITGSKLVCNKTGGYADMAQQPNVFDISPLGKRYRITYTISNYVTGSVIINYGGYQAATARSANGTYIQDVTLSHASSNTIVYVSTYTANFVGDIDDVIVELLSDNWNDLSGNRNTGTLISGSSYNTGSGGNIQFDGTDDYVYCPYNVSFKPSQITISAWIKPTSSTSNWSKIISYPYRVDDSWAEPYFSWCLSISESTTGKPNLIISTDNGGTFDREDCTATTSLTNGIWYFVVATYDGTNLKMYINGVLETTQPHSTAGNIKYISDSIVSIGNRSVYYIGEYANGKISNVQIYNRALTESEITQNFNAHKSRYSI